MKNTQKIWKPKRWLATLLSLFVGFSGLLYLGKGKLYLAYALAQILIFVSMFLASNQPMTELSMTFSLVSFLINIICAIHTYKICTQFQASSDRPWYSYWWGIVAIYLIIIIPIFLFRSFFYEPFHIPAWSMSPNYNKGDYVVISKLGYGNYGSYGIDLIHTQPSKKIQRGDVIVFANPQDPKIDYIKRVIGLPSDVVSYRSKQLFINNQPVTNKLIGDYKIYDEKIGMEIPFAENEESYEEKSWRVIHMTHIQQEDFELTVPPKHYFMLGDNRDNSADSRIFGAVPEKNIKGKVIYSTVNKIQSE